MAPGHATEPSAGSVLARAEAANAAAGHENAGSLSAQHGFLPRHAPALALPSTHAAWDDVAAELPSLHRGLRVRRAVSGLPRLSADPDALPDTALLRAASILGILAHAHHHACEAGEATLPTNLLEPWQQVCSRLERETARLSYVDLIVYNWRHRCPETCTRRMVESLDLLVPTVGNEAERIFYTSQVELLDRSVSAVAGAVEIQEAAHAGDWERVKTLLVTLADLSHDLLRTTFFKVDPNPHSATHVDPIVWGRTVAPLAVPIQPGVLSPGGASSPLIHLLDALFERTQFGSHVGQESRRNVEASPPHWRELIEAVGSYSLKRAVDAAGDDELAGLYHAAHDAYAGADGFLGKHRLKAYGYIEQAMKVGRTATNSGMSGEFGDNTWDAIDDELAQAREERFVEQEQHAYLVPVAAGPSNGSEDVVTVTFDLRGSGMRYRPGDQLGILPENSDELIQRTLSAIGAPADSPVGVNREWKSHLRLRRCPVEQERATLGDFMRYGRLRPVERAVAKTLHRLTLHTQLGHVIEARAEDQWELWDLIELLRGAGWDPRVMLRAGPGEPEYLGRLVRPLPFRRYSVASAMREPGSSSAVSLSINVGRLTYRTEDSDVSRGEARFGTASTFLAERAAAAARGETDARVGIRLVRPSRFALPTDSDAPVVMFAGGTGLAPFRGFLEARAGRAGSPDWLFWSVKTREDFELHPEIEQALEEDRLELRVVFTREPLSLRVGPGGGARAPQAGESRRVDAEMLAPDTATALAALGHDGASFYTCGQTGFAASVTRALQAVLQAEGPEAEQAGRTAFFALAGAGRYQQDVFTTYSGPQSAASRLHVASDVAVHNDPEHGYWCIIDGRVYDLTHFAELHPGGQRIIAGYAGMDATHAYRKVLHHVSPEVDSLLGMYEIGAVRRLDLGRAWGVSLGKRGLESSTLAEAYRRWIRVLHRVVEMQNALRNDHELQRVETIRDEDPDESSAYKAELSLQAHGRLVNDYLHPLQELVLPKLWALTCGLCSDTEDVRWMRQAVDAIFDGEPARTVRAASKLLRDLLEAAVTDGATTPPAELVEALARLRTEDLAFLQDMKDALRAGVQVFEHHEATTLADGATELLEAARCLPRAIEGYFARAARTVEAIT